MADYVCPKCGSKQALCSIFIHGSDSEPWIKVKDSLPEKKNKKYLCYDENQGVQEIAEWYYDFSVKKWKWYVDHIIPTHWMEKPPNPGVKK